MHTSLDDGALFYQLDVLEARSIFVVFGWTLTFTASFLPMYSSILTISIHSISTEYGGHNHLLGDDFTLIGSHLGSNFMDLASQVSFGPNLRKFKSSEHLHLHADYAKIRHMI